ncbi:WD40 repeat domain-containing protein [Kitasatospora sp. NPDC001660]
MSWLERTRTAALAPHDPGGLRVSEGEVTTVATAVVEGRPVAVSGSEGRAVQVWDLTAAHSVGTRLRGHTDEVPAVATGVVAGRPVVVTGSCGLQGGALLVRDLATGEPLGAPMRGTSRFLSAAVTELDGRPVTVTTSFDPTVQVWDLVDRRHVRDIPRPPGEEARAVGVLDDRTVVVTGSSLPPLHIWDLATHVRDLATGEQLGEPLRGTSGDGTALAVGTVEGRRVLVTGDRHERC